MAERDAATSSRHRLTIRPLPAGATAQTITFGGHISAADQDRLDAILVDPLLESGHWGVLVTDSQLDIGPLPGVTDTAAAQVLHAARLLGVAIDDASVGRLLDLDGPADDAAIRRRFANPVIERWSVGSSVEPGFAVGATALTPTQHVELPSTDEELLALGRERGLALDLAELQVIRAHFAEAGRAPTDAELETLAQTWSEHCAHKSFRADVILEDGTVVEPLLAQLRRSTTEMNAPFVVSAFDGNAGIVQFGPARTYALKCETHNHPSAVEPFGGANTGVGGVIRDILGAAHHPIACTDILCFGPADLDDDLVPDGVLHPRRIIEGVVAGVADYGNKIGLPTVAGSVLYDPAYVSNPLVFAGCIGVAPADRPRLTGPHAGDRIVILGGRTGRDGIRGATFSSMEMDATTGDVAGASVQIGDPIVEKLVSDLLVDAWHLYTAITDCGAGGLSSAIGELADGVGANVQLDLVPLKYAGLAPWEIWLSEAQERMVVAVAPSDIDALAELAELHGVDMSDVGSFSGDRQLIVAFGHERVIDLDTSFLHDGRPRRRLQAVLPNPVRDMTAPPCDDLGGALLALLAHPNIASKADVIRRYDHEIRGATVIRPLMGVGLDAPADGVVLAEPADIDGIVIGIGVNPWYGVLDSEHMALTVVDEAIRNVVVAGGDPSQVALMDNFSWGNPTRPTTFGELVVAVQACCAAADHHRAPFVSGKDSLNNEYLTSDGSRHAIPPTLVITAVAPIADVEHAMTPDFKRADDLVVVIGPTSSEFGGSHLAMVVGDSTPRAVPKPDRGAPQRYRRLHDAITSGWIEAAHDCSEGGLAVTLAEMAIGGRLGAQVQLAGVHDDPVSALFSESAGRVVVEIRPERLDDVIDVFGADAVVIGRISAAAELSVAGAFALTVDQLLEAFTAPLNTRLDTPLDTQRNTGINQ